jgi:hypothetical protein
MHLPEFFECDFHSVVSPRNPSGLTILRDLLVAIDVDAIKCTISGALYNAAKIIYPPAEIPAVRQTVLKRIFISGPIVQNLAKILSTISKYYCSISSRA